MDTMTNEEKIIWAASFAARMEDVRRRAAGWQEASQRAIEYADMVIDHLRQHARLPRGPRCDGYVDMLGGKRESYTYVDLSK